MSSDGPDDHPTIIALAGSNGAGKSTFYKTQLASLGWPFINADLLARDLLLEPYEAVTNRLYQTPSDKNEENKS